jgi:AcrR family transcriptional regulator
MTSVTESRDSQTRGRIAAAAFELFKQYGYQKTTVADIARKLGMSSANVYRFFDSKQAINEFVALRLTGEVEAACSGIADGPLTPPEKITGIIAAINAMSVERYTADVRMHEMVAAAMRDSWPIIKDHLDRCAAIIARVLEQGVRSGDFRRMDTQVTAKCLQAAIVRFTHPGMMLECRDMPEPSLQQQTDFVLKALAA